MPLTDDRESLVAQLRELGIRYLLPSDAQVDETQRLTQRELIAQLASHRDPRLRRAMIALFLLHPEAADDAAYLARMLDGTARTELMAHYMAAVYLQRMWQTRLGFYLHVQLLPDHFSLELALPSPGQRFGQTGLRALARWHAGQSGYPFNYLSSYETVMDLLFEQLKQEANRYEPA